MSNLNRPLLDRPLLTPHSHGPACVVEHATVTPDDAPARSVSASPLMRDHTTFHVGGPARNLVTATTEQELIEAVRTADAAGEPVLVVGGGSNLLVGDAGFPGTVVLVATRGLKVDQSACAGAYVTVAAGEVTDDLVATAVEREWVGLEALSGIPGLVGGTPVQNVGAYGVEASDVIARVRTFDRRLGQIKTLFPDDCGFGYRTSLFKQTPDRYVVLAVDFQLRLGPRSEPIRYADLAAHLGVELGERAPLADVRRAVLEVRRSRGMVADEADHDTWSAGSFFTNPTVAPDQAATLPADAPRHPQADGSVKLSAAWLIEHAGFAKGHARGGAALSSHHVLSLTNRGDATADDVVALAREVRDGVERAWGVRLAVEPTVVGCTI